MLGHQQLLGHHPRPLILGHRQRPGAGQQGILLLGLDVMSGRLGVLFPCRIVMLRVRESPASPGAGAMHHVWTRSFHSVMRGSKDESITFDCALADLITRGAITCNPTGHAF